MSEPRGTILVIRGGAIGDFIVTLPVLAALREHFPESRLELLSYPHIAQLALAGGLVDAVRSIEARPLAGFFAPGGDLDLSLGDYFSDCDLIISYLYDPDGVFCGNVARCSVAQFIQGPHRVSETAGRHATEVLLQPLERLAIFGADATPRLNLPPSSVRGDATESAADSIAGAARPLALHPGSGSETKNWSEENWRSLVDRLVQTTADPLLLVGGEAEGGRLERLARCVPPERLSLARSLPLVELGARLRGCRAFVGHDSGITHLAAAVGLSGVVLWGASSEQIWRPRSPRMHVLRSPQGLAGLSPGVVLEELHRVLRGNNGQ